MGQSAGMGLETDSEHPKASPQTYALEEEALDKSELGRPGSRAGRPLGKPGLEAGHLAVRSPDAGVDVPGRSERVERMSPVKFNF